MHVVIKHLVNFQNKTIGLSGDLEEVCFVSLL